MVRGLFTVGLSAAGLQYASPAADVNSMKWSNRHHSPETYESVMRQAGFRDFRWVPVALNPTPADNRL